MFISDTTIWYFIPIAFLALIIIQILRIYGYFGGKSSDKAQTKKSKAGRGSKKTNKKQQWRGSDIIWFLNEVHELIHQFKEIIVTQI